MNSVKHSTAHDAASPDKGLDALATAERAAVRARREAVLNDAASPHAAAPRVTPGGALSGTLSDTQRAAELALPRVGLALSGGGVRSATFGLGLLRGLAQSRPAGAAVTPAPPNPHDAPPEREPVTAPATATATAPRTLSSDGLLGRIDYLCTVSGGGYIGAMWARRVSQLGLRAAQNELARSDAPALHWLRRNGRYLTPAGSRDIGVGVVTYLRAWFAIHTEFMFASLCLGLLVMAPHLWQHSTGGLNVPGWSPWVTPWWVAALGLWVMAAPGLIAGYWVARDQPARATAHQAGRLWRNLRWRDALCMALLAALAYGLLRHWLVQDAMSLRRHGLNAPLLAALALVSAVLGTLGAQLVLALATAEHALAVAQLRNTFTQALRVAAVAALSLAGLGALDALSWWLLQELHTGNPWLWSGMGLGGAAVVLLRSLAQPLQHIAAEAGAQARAWLPRLLNLAGLIGLGVLVTAWLVLAQWFVFAPQTFDAFTPLPAALRAAVLAAVWALWVVLTAGNAQMANSSSLHHFYRARITRAYLAVGNPARQLDGHEASADVTRVTEGDDTALTHHRPETRGGPIHLITTCLNQTRDDRSGLYNADRKGVALTASWRGLELGPDQFIAAQPDHDLGTLGRWVAVSGAAASPGAGAYTSRGLALLVYLLGVRMGHWMRAPSGLRQGGVFTRLAWACLPKPLMLASEASATFHGPHRPWWYLSDGGHFENTGVYALLKRELDFIILSDAGCDTHYQFGDIENLVRKARIDFGAEIDFYTREEAARLFPSATQAPAAQARASGKAHCDGQTLTVLSPEDLADNHSCRGVLLARIRYRERNRPGPHGAGQRYRPEGTLLLVKPNLHNALDVDVLAYARQHETFPQEPTGDQ